MLATLEHTHYGKTEKGAQEISERRNNLRGRMRTMLILVDSNRSADELMEHARTLGAPADFLEVMVREGYIAPAGAPARREAARPLAAVTPTRESTAPAAPADNPDTLLPVLEDVAPPELVPIAVPEDELARFRVAKSFMNETVVNALGFRAFMFTLRLERCVVRADLATLLPDYEKAVRKGVAETEALVLMERMRALLA
jgi:hypothetical protein